MPLFGQQKDWPATVAQWRTALDAGTLSPKMIIRGCAQRQAELIREPVPVQADFQTLWGHALCDAGGKASLLEARKKYETALQLRAGYFGALSKEAAFSHVNLANALYALSDTAAAEAHYTTALRLHIRPSGDTAASCLSVLRNLARLYHAQGRYEAADSCLQRGLILAQDTFGPTDARLFPFLEAGAETKSALGQTREALTLLQRAYPLREAFGPATVAWHLLRLATALEENAETRQATLTVHRALGAFESLPNTFAKQRGRIYSALLLAKIAVREDRLLPDGHDWYGRALAWSRPLDKRDALHWEVRKQYAATLIAEGQAGKARTLLREAPPFSGDTRRQTEWLLLAARSDLLLKKDKTALENAQKAVALAGVSPSLLRLEALGLLISAHRCYATAAPQPQAEWQTVLQLGNLAADCLDQLRFRYRALFTRNPVQNAWREVCAGAVEAALQTGDTLLAFQWAERVRSDGAFPRENMDTRPGQEATGQVRVSYLLHDRDLFIFTHRAATLRATHTTVVPAALQATIRDFFYDCSVMPSQWGSQKDGMSRRLCDHAEQLYALLLRDVLQPGDHSLTIVPDSWLCFLPFEALLTERVEHAGQFHKHPWLLHRCAVRYLYSARPAGGNAASGPPATKVFWGLAPSFGGHDRNLPPLPGSAAEVEALGNMVPGARVTIGTAATSASFLAEAGQYRILHLSTHGMADSDYPAYSALFFSDSSSRQDRLYAADIANMSLPGTQMVVLSACQTRFGLLSEGEGLLSLAYAFQKAGAASFAASLWNVSDKKGAFLQQFFYRHLLRGLSKSDALRAARMHYLAQASRETGHPFYWAGLQIYGEDTALFQTGRSCGFLVLCCLLIAALIAGLWKFRRPARHGK